MKGDDFRKRLDGLIGRLPGLRGRAARGDPLYDEASYLDAYSAHTDLRVAEDPQRAVGGMWEEIGQLQFEFLVSEGLTPGKRMLDIGCGTLRGGRHFIRYLEAGNYSGIDISAGAIAYAELLLRTEGLTEKRPRLVVSENKNLRFGEFEGERFDFLLAQSVFTHLPPEPIEECFAHVGAAMAPGAVFFFTFFEAPQLQRTSPKDFRYPYRFFEELAARRGFAIDDRSSRFPHPRSQHMAALFRRQTT